MSCRTMRGHTRRSLKRRAEALVQSETSACGISGGQSDTGTSLPASTSVLPRHQYSELIYDRHYVYVIYRQLRCVTHISKRQDREYN